MNEQTNEQGKKTKDKETILRDMENPPESRARKAQENVETSQKR